MNATASVLKPPLRPADAPPPERTFVRPGVADPLGSITINLRLHLPCDLMQRMDAESERDGLSFEDVLIRRLRRTANFEGQKPLYFNDEQRRHLERFLGRNFDHAHEVVDAVKHTHTMHVSDTKVALQPRLLERLKSRQKVTGADWNVFLQNLVVEELERWVGMR